MSTVILYCPHCHGIVNFVPYGSKQILTGICKKCHRQVARYNSGKKQYEWLDGANPSTSGKLVPICDSDVSPCCGRHLKAQFKQGSLQVTCFSCGHKIVEVKNLLSVA